MNLASPPLPDSLALHRILIGVLVLRLLVQERERAIVIFIAGLVRAKTRSEAGCVCSRAAASWTGAASAISLQVVQTGHPTSGSVQPR